jgi:hypothetical protein
VREDFFAVIPCRVCFLLYFTTGFELPSQRVFSLLNRLHGKSGSGWVAPLRAVVQPCEIVRVCLALGDDDACTCIRGVGLHTTTYTKQKKNILLVPDCQGYRGRCQKPFVVTEDERQGSPRFFCADL